MLRAPLAPAITMAASGAGAGGDPPVRSRVKQLKLYPRYIPEDVDLHSAEKLENCTETDYAKPEYWDRRYTKDGAKGMEYSFEWYCDPEQGEACDACRARGGRAAALVTCVPLTRLLRSSWWSLHARSLPGSRSPYPPTAGRVRVSTRADRRLR